MGNEQRAYTIVLRLIRLVEREAGYLGVDIEPEVTKIIGKLESARQNH